METARFRVPFLLLDGDLFPGANAQTLGRVSPPFRGPFPRKQAGGPGNPPEILGFPI